MNFNEPRIGNIFQSYPDKKRMNNPYIEQDDGEQKSWFGIFVSKNWWCKGALGGVLKGLDEVASTNLTNFAY